MQDDSGAKRALGIPWVYECFQRAVGAERLRGWLAHEVWCCPAHAKVVDVGCGPGDVMQYLPIGVRYIGIDISPEYIDKARARFGERGCFYLGTAASLIHSPQAHEFREADLVLCNGLLHHLDDPDAENVFAFARETLAPNGRLVCLEPCYLRHQGKLSRWFMSRDRGRNVRTEQEWKTLAGKYFPKCRTNVLIGLIRLPYVHILIECSA